jgi:hypothetical protein
MYSIQSDQDISRCTMGRCTYGAARDHETLDLVPRQVDEGMTIEERYNAPPVPLSRNLGRSFLYARCNADLSRRGLDHLGFGTSIQRAFRKWTSSRICLHSPKLVRQQAVATKGTFDKWDATLTFAPDLATEVSEVEIQAANVDTGSGMKNFKSTRIVQTRPETLTASLLRADQKRKT